MWWKILLEIVIGILMLMFSLNFWSIIRLPAHLRYVLGDSRELKRILNILGPDRLIKESENVEPVFGSYIKNILIDHQSLSSALLMTKFLMLFGTTVLIVVSYFLGTIFVAINFLLFLLPMLLGPQAIAKQHNYNHLHTVILNIYKWNKVNPDECLSYCNEKDISLKQVYLVVRELK